MQIGYVYVCFVRAYCEVDRSVSWNTPSVDGACFKFNDRDCILVQWVAYRRAPSQLTVTVSGANSAAILSTTL